MLRTDALWRNGGRWLSLALLGGLAINAAPVEAAGATTPVKSWISLANGQLCRTWSAPSSAVRELEAKIPLMSAANSLSAQALSLDAASQRSQPAKGIAAGLTSVTVAGANTIAVTHCASQWRITSDNHLVSGAPTWVPNPTGGWPTLDDSDTTTLAFSSPALKSSARMEVKYAPRAQHAVTTIVKTAPPKPRASAPATGGYAPVAPAPGGIGPWVPVPGHPTYGMGDYAGDPYSAEFGVCTWWAWYQRQDEPALGTLGMAYSWIANAQARGMRTGTTPVAGATVVFQPGVQGAGGGGHAAHVVQVLSGGWFIISEMNFYWNGGGWARVDYRYVHTGPGVAFIY